MLLGYHLSNISISANLADSYHHQRPHEPHPEMDNIVGGKYGNSFQVTFANRIKRIGYTINQS